MGDREEKEKNQNVLRLRNLTSPPTPPLCGMASPYASLSLGMAMRTSPKGEGEQNILRSEKVDDFQFWCYIIDTM